VEERIAEVSGSGQLVKERTCLTLHRKQREAQSSAGDSVAGSVAGDAKVGGVDVLVKEE
jgi:hypothetical protein